MALYNYTEEDFLQKRDKAFLMKMPIVFAVNFDSVWNTDKQNITLGKMENSEKKEELQQQEQQQAQCPCTHCPQMKLDKFLNTFLKICLVLDDKDAENLTIGGSFGLALLGLVDIQNVHDLDLRITNPSKATIEALKKLEAISPAYSGSFVNRREAGAQFTLEGISVDIFFLKEDFDSIYMSIFSPNGGTYKVRVAKAMDIIKAKKALKRLKDIPSLLALANSIISDQEIKEIIESALPKK